MRALQSLFIGSPITRARDCSASPATLPGRQANYAWDKTLLRASFSFRDVVDGAMANKLSSGLPTVIAMRAYVFREGSSDPIALAIRTCRVVYDLWDEVYRIKVTGPGGERDLAAINVEGVLRQCAEARDLPVVDRSLLRRGTAHFLGVIVDVNPISPEMLEQITLVRRSLMSMRPIEAMEGMVKQLGKTKTNAEFLMTVSKFVR